MKKQANDSNKVISNYVSWNEYTKKVEKIGNLIKQLIHHHE